jgi:hyperosmotically inducible protein
MRPACSFRRSRRFRRSRSFRLQAEVLLLVLLLAACGATTSSTRDDASISTRVKIALLADPQVGQYRIDAKTFQGVVTLTGTVKTQAEADQAVAVARKAVGVKDVKSELKVGGQQSADGSLQGSR